MGVALITGSAGLIGSEAARHFAGLGMHIAGIDNDMRRYFFGSDGSTEWTMRLLVSSLGSRYTHFDVDIRDREGLGRSTNKVYGDTPNRLPFIELEARYELEPDHPLTEGIDESMGVDASLHSPFGAAKLAADVMVQEYGRCFGMRTACFRGGTLTGPARAAAELHGFLAFLMRCVMAGRTYQLHGYKGKMVRDAIHSRDVLSAFEAFFSAPRSGEVYNLGGGRFSCASHIEAFALAEEITGHPAKINYHEQSRTGDHQWYISK